MLRRMGRMLAAHGRPFIIAGDWNMVPDDVNELGLPSRLCATVVSSAAYTCFSSASIGTVARHLDFFLVSDALLSLICEVRAISTEPNPRVPVVIKFFTFTTVQRVRVPIRAAALPDARPVAQIDIMPGKL